MESAGKRDLYEVLGVARDADAKQIRKAYRKLARRHHPDVNPGDAAAEEEFKAVSEAHAVLAAEAHRLGLNAPTTFLGVGDAGAHVEVDADEV